MDGKGALLSYRRAVCATLQHAKAITSRYRANDRSHWPQRDTIAANTSTARSRRLPLNQSAYLAVAKATVVSSMRFEKPHSLSYQLETFTRLPRTFVNVASKFDDAGLWLKSTDTSGAVL